MPAWFWFVVALLAAGGGALLLLSERSGPGDRSRGRRRWAEQKSWEFVRSDPVLPGRWQHGAARDGRGTAVDLATGAVPGPGGRRLAHVFDLEHEGRVTDTVAAVRGVATVPVALELRLPSAPLPDDAGLDSMGQVGDRYAFVAHVGEARPLITDAVARAADRVGDDVPLVWAEDTWVLASTESSASPERMQEVLQALVGVSVALEEAVDVAEGRAPAPPVAPAPSASGPASGPDPEEERDTDVHDVPVTEADRVATAPTGPVAPDATADTDVHEDLYDDEYAYDDVDLDELDDAAPAPPAAPARDADPARDATTAPTGATSATHKDRPGDVPYDVEADSERDDRGSGSSRWGSNRPGLRGVPRR